MEQSHKIFSFNSKGSTVHFIPVGWFTSACVFMLQMLKPPSISPCFFLFLSTNFLCAQPPPPASTLWLWTFFKSGFKLHKTSVLMLEGSKAKDLYFPPQPKPMEGLTGFHTASNLQSKSESHHLVYPPNYFSVRIFTTVHFYSVIWQLRLILQVLKNSFRNL